MLKKIKVDNAVIMAAGLSSRFAPISYEYPKALVKVKGEVLIERQIKQLKEKGIHDITVIVGYKKELFNYLKEKFGVRIIENPEFNNRNNHSSLYYAKEVLKNTYICSADNYFSENVFESYVEDSFYSSIYHEGITDEWCIETNKNDYITSVKIGGNDAWIMLGHVFFSQEFSNKFISILNQVYDLTETRELLWETIFINNLHTLPMKIKRYKNDVIFEFDSLDELRKFDTSYINHTRSKIIAGIASDLNCKESDLTNIHPIKKENKTVGFKFITPSGNGYYEYASKELTMNLK